MPTASGALRIGISACLLGHKVRYDGDHRRERTLTMALRRHVEFVPVCPEVEVGMGIPREPVRLVGKAPAPRMVGVASGTDPTRAMRAWARRRVAGLLALNLSGFVLKAGSPSCGPARVKLQARETSAATRAGVGLFARALLDRYPLLPVEDESRLADAAARQRFLARVVAYRRWRDFEAARYGVKRLEAFHAAQRPLLLSRAPIHAVRLDRIVAAARARGAARTRADYGCQFMAAAASGRRPIRSRERPGFSRSAAGG